MTYPTNIYQAPSGTTLYGGRDGPPVAVTPPGTVPSWATNAPLNAWIEIPGSAGAGGTTIESYSGWAQLPNAKLAIALAGGHTDGNKNNVVTIDLLQSTPTWIEVCPESPTHAAENMYEADGKPACCHTYQTLAWVPPKNRLMRFGAVGYWGAGGTVAPYVDGVNLSVSPAVWDPAGTHASLAPLGQQFSSGACYNPITDRELLIFGGQYFDPMTGTKTTITNAASLNMPRNPWVWDSNRKQMFGLCWGDNQQYGPQQICAAVINGTTATAITIAPSAAASQFAVEKPYDAGMNYDPYNDCFYFYDGAGVDNRNRVYKITPNNTNTWTMSIFTYGSGGISPLPTVPSGIMNKFSYVPELKGIVMMTNKTSNLYYMRTA